MARTGADVELLRVRRAAALAAGKEKKKAAETKKTVKVRTPCSFLLAGPVSLAPVSAGPYRPQGLRTEGPARQGWSQDWIPFLI